MSLSTPYNPTPLFQHIGIFGLGLIGGSLALRLRQAYPEIKIFGFDTQQEVLNYAAAHSMIQEGTSNPTYIPDDLDLAIVCTPIEFVNATLQLASDHGPDNLVLTDVASIKSGIGNSLRLKSGQTFIGGHPLAGKADVGIAHAEAALLVNAVYMLTDTHSESGQRLSAFLSQLGVTIIQMDVATHDAAVAYTSHMPYFLSTALILAHEASPDAFQSVMGPAYKGMTRISGSDPKWGVQVGSQNRAAIRTAIQAVQSELQQLDDLLDNPDALYTQLQRAYQLRQALFPH